MARTFDSVLFPDTLRLARPLGSGGDWELEEDFRVFWTDGVEQTYTVKAALVTDMASIPWWAQGLPGFQKAGKATKPSIPHDAMYERREPGWTRKEVDRLFYKGLRAEGVNWITARAMYLAVRIGGKQTWDT